jgi:hypothetical protein
MVARAQQKQSDKKPLLKKYVIDETIEYDVFERFPGNRPVDEGHVIDLMRRMKRKDLKTPIQINQEFQVIDGQHRLESRKRLKLPVYFFCAEEQSLTDIQDMNAGQKSWRNDDYVESFIEQGKKDYEVYKWFRDHYALPHSESVIILQGIYSPLGTKGVGSIFKSGSLKVGSLAEAKKIAERFKELQPFFDGWNHSKFVSAMLSIMKKRRFDWKHFIGKVKANPAYLKRQATTDMYLQHIEDLYNYRSKDKVALRYGEDK